MRILIRYFFRTLRVILGPFVLLGEKLSTPKGIERPPEDQARVDAETENLTLYQFRTCPFCIKVRKVISLLSLNIDSKDAQHDPDAKAELREGGGEVKVPCLRIDNADGSSTWMYESDDIIAYLKSRFAPQGG